jgi:hypothetical protein
MTDKDKHGSIFDFSARKSPSPFIKKTTHPVPKKPETPAPLSKKPDTPISSTKPQVGAQQSLAGTNLKSNEQVMLMLGQMRQLRKELQDKFEEVCTLGGITPKELELYLSKLGGPALEELKKKKDDLENKMWSSLGQQAKIKRRSTDQDKVNKKRKAKSIGARRNWIPTK